MAKRNIGLGEAELEVLNHVLELGEASVHDVRERIQKYRPLAYTTVMTLMKKLADKGYLDYRKEGKAYLYRPSRSRESLKSGLLRRFVQSAFGGSALDLVQTLVTHGELTSQELREVDQLIAKMKAEKGSNDND